MAHRTDIIYDAERKIWSSPSARDYFGPELSIGEIIFQEMRRHSKLIAQVSNIYTIRLLKIVKKWYSLFVQLYVAGVTGDVADPTKYYIHILA